MNTAVRLRAALALSGHDIAWLARTSGVKPRTLGSILDIHRPPREMDRDAVSRIAGALGLPVAWLVADQPQRALDWDTGAIALSCTERLRRLVRNQQVRPADPSNVRRHPWAIPHIARVRGAKKSYRVCGTTLGGLALLDGDLVFVQPMTRLRQCVNRLIVFFLNESLYLKRLTIGPKSVIQLNGAIDDYDPIVVRESDDFELIGRVVLILRQF